MIATAIHTLTSSSYVLTETDLAFEKKVRKDMLNKIAADYVLTTKAGEVYCIELAIELMEISLQAYNDAPNLVTLNGFAPLDLASFNYTLISLSYNKEHDTVLYIVRHNTNSRVVVVFRGSCSAPNWSDNLRMSQTPLKLENEFLTHLDDADGLSTAVRDIDSNGGYEMLYDEYVNQVDDRDRFRNTNEDALFSRQGGLYANMMNRTKLFGYGEPSIHTGFWDAYQTVRDSLHLALRQALIEHPAQLHFTGHSLGGSLSTIAALDFKLHSLPRVNKYLLWKGFGGSGSFLHNNNLLDGNIINTNTSRFTISSSRSLQTYGPSLFASNNLPNQLEVERNVRTTELMAFNSNMSYVQDDDDSINPILNSNSSYNKDSTSIRNDIENSMTISRTPERDRQLTVKQTRKSKRLSHLNNLKAISTANILRVEVGVYSYGSPRIFNRSFAEYYDEMVPDTFRTICDGDFITSMPNRGYKHVGTEVLIDTFGIGSIILDQSHVEKWLRSNVKTSLSVHSLFYYKQGLVGIKHAMEYILNRTGNTLLNLSSEEEHEAVQRDTVFQEFQDHDDHNNLLQVTSHHRAEGE